MVTFIESPLFTKQVHDYLTDDEYSVFQAFLSTNPDAGAQWYVVPAESARYVGAVKGPEKAVVSGVSILHERKLERSGCS